MTKHQIINLLVDYYQYHTKPTPLAKYHDWAIEPIKQGMMEMFTMESLESLLRNQIRCKKCDNRKCYNRIQAIKNYKDLISNTTCQNLTNGEMLKMAKIEIDKILKTKSQYDDYDGDCNYCDDDSCTNGECKEQIND